MMPTAIHRQVEAARRGELSRVIARMRSGWAVLGDPQITRGYCLLLPDPVVPDLNALSGDARRQFLDDMAALGDAVLAVTGAERINYEILGNVEPALHAHVIPRHATEEPHLRRQAVWLHDWKAAPPVDSEALALAQKIAAGCKTERDTMKHERCCLSIVGWRSAPRSPSCLCPPSLRVSEHQHETPAITKPASPVAPIAGERPSLVAQKHDRTSAHRRRARRSVVGDRAGDRHVRAAGAAGRAAGVGSHRSARALRRRPSVHRRPRVLVAGRDGDRNAPRRGSAVRRGQLPGDPRHLPRFTQRLHVRDDAARREARTADLRRRRRRRPRRHGQHQPQLGRRVGRGREDRERRLDGGDRDPVQHGALRAERRADVGRQLPAPHPPQERDRAVVADPEGLHADAREHGRRAAGAVGHFARPRPAAEAVPGRRRSRRPDQPRPREPPMPSATSGSMRATA